MISTLLQPGTPNYFEITTKRPQSDQELSNILQLLIITVRLTVLVWITVTSTRKRNKWVETVSLETPPEMA